MAGRCEGAGVAVGEDPSAVGHVSSPRAPDSAIGLDIGAMERERRLGEPRRRRLRILSPRAERRAHAVQGPDEIHGGRPARGQIPERDLHCGVELGARAALLPLRFERDTEGRGAADRRSAAHDHRTNGLGDFGRARAAHVFEARGEGTLVDQLEPRPPPAQGLDRYRFR